MKNDFKIIIIIVLFCIVCNVGYFLVIHGAFPHITMLIHYYSYKDDLIEMIYDKVSFDVDFFDSPKENEGIKYYMIRIEDVKNEKLLQVITDICNEYLVNEKESICLMFYWPDSGPETHFATISNVNMNNDDHLKSEQIQYLYICNIFDEYYSKGEMCQSGRFFENLSSIRYLEMDKESKDGFDKKRINWYEVYPELNSFMVTVNADEEEIKYKVARDGVIR